MEQTRHDISYVLHKVRKKIEGKKRGVPYSKKKVKRRSTIACWKARLSKVKGSPHSKKAMENREQHVETNLIEEEGETVTKLKEAKEKFKELVKKGLEHRDKELMEMYPTEIDEDSVLNRRKKKKY